MQGKIGQNSKVIAISTPKSYSNTAATAEWINMKNCEKVRWVISVGAWAGGTAAVTIGQSLSDAGSIVSFPMATYDWISGETVTETTVTSDTFNITTAHIGTVIVIEAKATDLTRTNLGSTSYDWVALAIATPGANADFYSVTAEVFGLKYGNSATVLA